jgi:cytoskeletal protein CcmA (bactofilin family)
LTADVSLRIGATAKVVGDLQAPRISVVRGAKLQGNITMKRRLAEATVLDDIAAEQVLSRGA